MKKSMLSILIATMMIAGCEKELKQFNLKSSLDIVGGCNNYSSTRILETPNNESCIHYVYEKSNKQLIITHYNAAFNCCPGKINCETILYGNSIQISEKEETVGCHCLCLYDIQITIADVEEDEYNIKIIEPYTEELEEISATINLGTNPTGDICVQRNRYPWVL